MGKMSLKNKYSYVAFGLTIASEIELPELLAKDPTHASLADVTILYDEVSLAGMAVESGGRCYFQASKKVIGLEIPHVGRFLMSEGKYIIIEPIAGVDPVILRLFVLSSCLSALLMQRDLFVLHGNAIKIGDACISFLGASGIGKSTLSGAFFRRGYSLLAEDVCAINQDFHVLPSIPQIKLWPDSAHKLGINTETLRRVRPDFDKFYLPLGEQFYSKALPLRVIYCLGASTSDAFDAQNALGVHKIMPLQQHIYRRDYLKGLLKEKLYYEQSALLSKQIDVIHLKRPTHGFQLDQLVDYVENDLRKYDWASSSNDKTHDPEWI
jgi:hypothetical protein